MIRNTPKPYEGKAWPGLKERESAVLDAGKGLMKQQWLSTGTLPNLLGFDSKSPHALLDARDKLGAAFEKFLSEGALPERRELISNFVAKLDPALHETVQQKVFQNWLDNR
jgi:hypothetical protein